MHPIALISQYFCTTLHFFALHQQPTFLFPIIIKSYTMTILINLNGKMCFVVSLKGAPIKMLARTHNKTVHLQ